MSASGCLGVIRSITTQEAGRTSRPGKVDHRVRRGRWKLTSRWRREAGQRRGRSGTQSEPDKDQGAIPAAGTGT